MAHSNKKNLPGEAWEVFYSTGPGKFLSHVVWAQDGLGIDGCGHTHLDPDRSSRFWTFGSWYAAKIHRFLPESIVSLCYYVDAPGSKWFTNSRNFPHQAKEADAHHQTHTATNHIPYRLACRRCHPFRVPRLNNCVRYNRHNSCKIVCLCILSWLL